MKSPEELFQENCEWFTGNGDYYFEYISRDKFIQILQSLRTDTITPNYQTVLEEASKDKLI